MAPTLSILLLVYNQRATVAQAVHACLAQTGQPVEIILSDDASSDGSWELMQSIAAQYQGPHRVVIRRNPVNLGIGEHYNQAIAASSGELLLTAAGDDISLPGRCNAVQTAWEAHGKRPDLIASHLIDMDVHGQDMGVIRVADLSRWSSPAHWLAKRPYVVGAGHAFTRRMHDYFGPFAGDLAYEDQVLSLRACCMGAGITLPDAWVRYRRGGLSASDQARTTPQGFVAWCQRKHQRQRAVLTQVKHDLATAGHAALWGGKSRANLARSELALRLLDRVGAGTTGGLWTLLRSHPHAGWAWTLRNAPLLTHPDWGARVQHWQNAIKRK